MGVFTYENEVAIAIPPSRLFKAFVLDSQNLMPKAVPHAIKKVDVEGDGGAGTIKKVYFAEGMQFNSITQKVESIDEENLTYSYSVIEGDALMDTLEKITYSTKLVASPDGGSIFKTTVTYYTKGDIEITEDKIMSGKEKALGMFKAVEGYLLAHPEEYS